MEDMFYLKFETDINTSVDVIPLQQGASPSGGDHP